LGGRSIATARSDYIFTHTNFSIDKNGEITNSGGGWKTTFTPTIGAQSGSFTSVSATARYKAIGKTIFFNLKITITTNGTAASAVSSTLPFSGVAGRSYSLAGTSSLGKALWAEIQGGILYIKNYDNSYPGANGVDLNVSGSYEAA
jgi:hypothetical protein